MIVADVPQISGYEILKCFIQGMVKALYTIAKAQVFVQMPSLIQLEN